MIDDEDNPLLEAAAVTAIEKDLRRLSVHHQRITVAFIHDVRELIERHRARARQILGIVLPPVVMMVVPRLNILELGRADWDIAGISRAVDNFVVKHLHKGLQKNDVDEMIRAAGWPGVNSLTDLLVDESWHIARARARKAYVDETFPERACDHCSRLYRGPAVYCSLECAEADA